MRLTGLHLLLTYQCTLECDHCFTWGSPWQSGAMTLEQIEDALGQAEEVGSIEWIYFEGGEPLLYYAVLLAAVRMASGRGFKVGVVSNGYWATSKADAAECLRPFGGMLQDLAISCDRYHLSDRFPERAEAAGAAAQELGIPFGIIEIAQPEAGAAPAVGQLPEDTAAVVYRGRAAEKLAERGGRRSWSDRRVPIRGSARAGSGAPGSVRQRAHLPGDRHRERAATCVARALPDVRSRRGPYSRASAPEWPGGAGPEVRATASRRVCRRMPPVL